MKAKINTKVFNTKRKKEISKNFNLIFHLIKDEHKIPATSKKDFYDSRKNYAFSELHNNKMYRTKTYVKVITPLIDINKYLK